MTNVSNIKKSFNGGEYGCYWVSGIVDRLLDNVFALRELVGHQMTVVVLKASQQVHGGAVDRIGCAVADIREVRFLDRGNVFLYESLLHYCHLLEQTHSIGVCDPHVGICVGGCAIRDDESTRVSRLDEESGQDESVLSISEH